MSEYEKICPICDRPFSAKSNGKKYCSNECRVTALKRRDYGFHVLPPAKEREYRQENRKNSKQRAAEAKRRLEARQKKQAGILEQIVIEVEGKSVTLYQCAMMDMRATTLPCGFRDDCFRLHCPHIPRAV